MKIKILESAKEDLKEGYYFYEAQQICNLLPYKK